MKFHLFEHNQKAYDKAVAIMEEKGKAAIIHPTGTGKSFIGFQLAYDCPDARVCWLAPSEYIFNVQLENLRKISWERAEAVSKNIQFLSYSRLTVNEKDVKDICPDYIVLDEFHRCGAAEWGKSVRRLLEMYPEAKLLGLSATNIRYLDNQRDMAQEIFEGNIASEMTLGEAIARGILKAPKYIMAIYSYEQELYKLEQRVKTEENRGFAVQNEKLLEQLRRALEQANNLAEIFGRHMKEKHGKYIVFCANKAHMDEMKEHIQEWFYLVDKNPHIYTAYYGNPGTSRDFAAFKEDNEEHLKLLFCIDMLNEGVHVEGISGVILLRPTVSPIIYLQQIGRSLSAADTEEPIIFDLVNNFNSLCCINYLEQEIDTAFSFKSGMREKTGKFAERFQIVDEAADSRLLFDQLQRNLSSAWETYYLAAAQYYEENGNLKIPKGYVTATGLTVGSWLGTQRKIYAGSIRGELTEERISRLNAIGMIWDVRAENWEKGYRELALYFEKYGNTDVKARYVSDSGFALGKWVNNLRCRIKKQEAESVLTEEQLAKLKSLGMIWDKGADKWNSYIDAARRYHQKYGDLKVPVKYVTEDGIPLGNWVHAIKNGVSGDKKRADVLSPQQKMLLSEMGMEWEKDYVSLWNDKYELAKKYFEEHGDLKIPVAYCVDGVRLGKWISSIRYKRKNPNASGRVLDEERIQALNRIGMDWR